MATPTPSQRSLIGRVSANARWARATREERHQQAARARANSPASITYWETKIDPDGQLDPAERTRRAGYLKAEYYARLTLASAKARAARKTRGDAA